jgi:hypothetical protein
MKQILACVVSLALLIITVGASQAFDLQQQRNGDGGSRVPNWTDTKRFIEYNRKQIADMFKKYDPVTGEEVRLDNTQVEPDFDRTLAYAKRMAKRKEQYRMYVRDQQLHGKTKLNATERAVLSTLGVKQTSNLYLVVSANDTSILHRYADALSNCMKEMKVKDLRPMILLTGVNVSEAARQVKENMDAIYDLRINGSNAPVRLMANSQIDQMFSIRRLPAIVIVSAGGKTSTTYMQTDFCYRLSSARLQGLESSRR